MKISLLDKDMKHAAMLAVLIKKSIPNVSIEYHDDMSDTAISTSTTVIADPSPMNTKEWITSFRRLHGSTPLVLVTENTDALSGSFGDPCYVLSKPVLAQDIVTLLKLQAVGRPYLGGIQDGKRAN